MLNLIRNLGMMLSHANALCLQRATASSFCSYFSQSGRRYVHNENTVKHFKLLLSSSCPEYGLQSGFYDKRYPLYMSLVANIVGRQFRIEPSTRYHSLRSQFSRLPYKRLSSGWNLTGKYPIIGGVTFAVLSALLASGTAHAKASMDRNNANAEGVAPATSLNNGKKVHTNYSITGIPGDGRCMFRSVVHGACIRAGKPMPSEELQRELADELRDMIADEYIKRRAETAWFVEGDFDEYVARIRRPHVWGGEPELFMASHVLQAPITVYMYNEEAGGLIAIAEYGQEYGKDDPIRVLYHGYGHYDALHIPGETGAKSRL